MFFVLVYAIAGVFAVFSGLTLLIVLGKVWRESVEAYQRSRRREIEPAILAYAHADGASPLPGGMAMWLASRQRSDRMMML